MKVAARAVARETLQPDVPTARGRARRTAPTPIRRRHGRSKRGADADLSKAVEIAPRVWWVGSLSHDDPFQCHVYLIEQGDQSVLVDPGSALIADDVIRKVDSVVGVANVRWLICSHSDPDILGALPGLIADGLHPDAAIVTHWRNEALIRHSGTPLPYWRIEDNDWQLPLEDRTLRFVFTPYAHFAGSFCTFDETTGTLFSSDLFGGFSDDRSLFASSVDYFEAMRAFHEHYMPSREIVVHSLDQLRDLPLRQIAPQHGQIIPEELIAPIMDRLGRLECGIYLLARQDPGLDFLLAANRALHSVVDAIVREPRFSAVAAHVADLARTLIHADGLAIWGRAGATVLEFEAADGFAGHPAEPPADVADALSGSTAPSGSDLFIQLRSPATGQISGVAVLGFEGAPALDAPTRAVVDEIAGLVEVGLQREVMRRLADLDRAALYQQATHDPLTGLYNRAYLADAARRVCAIDDRRKHPRLAALMIDVDHFKRVNDSFGHPAGDVVLQRVARLITAAVRPSDLAVRYGGEEFLVLLSDVNEPAALAIAERIRNALALPAGDGPTVTASIGLAMRSPREHYEALAARADVALYAAKAGGRDRIELAP